MVYPAFLVGSYCGVMISVALGELYLIILFLVMLIFFIFKAMRKAVLLYRDESE